MSEYCRSVKDGVVLLVSVKPNAKKNGIEVTKDKVKISVTCPPEKGKANQKIIELLSNSLKVKKTQIGCIRGLTSSKKTLLIQGLSRAKVLENLNLLMIKP